MKWRTPCEVAYVTIVPYIRVLLIKKLIEKGVPVRKACKSVGLSVTSFERHKTSKNIELLEKDEDINDMIEALANRVYSGDKVEPITFCIICSSARKLFGLSSCPLS